MAHQYYVYMTTNLINGKSYIGKHIGRLDDDYLGSGIRLNNSIQKYGKDNFRKAILEVCDSDAQAYEREAHWVEHFDAVKNPNFYNLCGGGAGTGSSENHPRYGKTHSDETRRKMSEARKGKTHSDEHRRKISEAKQNISAETRRKISDARKGKTHSDETRRKMSEAKKGENHPMYGKTGKDTSNFKHRPDITKERIESLFTENPKIKRHEVFERLNVGEGVFTRIINELYGVPTFTALKKKLRKNL